MKLYYDIETISKGKDISDYELQLRMYKTFMDELIDDISSKLTKYYDDLAFSMLSQYGIDRKNLTVHKGRLVILQLPLNDHYYIDGEYKFSITKIPTIDVEENDNDGLNFTFLFKVEVIESMKGTKYEQ